VDITIKNLQKRIVLDSGVSAAIRKVSRKTCKLEGRKNRDIQITVCLVNNRRMQKFNLKYMNQNKPTDVLSFNLSEKRGKSFQSCLIADIIVSAETAISNSRVFKTSPLYELLLYVAHGLLHIFGYEDKNSRQKKIMQDKAERILKLCHVHP
jgi:probable rRNA maturation factor